VFDIPKIPPKASAVDTWEDLLVVSKTIALWSFVESFPIFCPLDELIQGNFAKFPAWAIASSRNPPEGFIPIGFHF